MSEITIDYKPLAAQAAFHLCRDRVKCMLGGVGSGKTRAGGAEAANHALNQPGCDGMIVSPTYNMLTRLSLPSFLETLPKQAIREHRRGDRVFVLHNGARVWYASADRPETLDGSNLAWFWVDEARYIKRTAYTTLLARLRQPGARRHQGFLTTTPEMNWLFDEFGSDSKPEDRGIINAKTADNYHNPADYIDQMRRSYSASLFEMYVGGQFVHLAGGVFDDFSARVHVQPLTVDPKLPVNLAVDFGYRSPAVLYFQLLPFCSAHKSRQCMHIIDEDQPSNTPTRGLVELIGRKFKRNSWRKGLAYVDPAGAAASIVEGYSDVSLLKGDGWRVLATYDPRKRWIPYGIDQIRIKLNPHDGPPSLYIDPKCNHERGIVRSLQASKYPEKKAGVQANIPEKCGVYDHARDALRYAVIGLNNNGVKVL
jgi:hypothetical protein